MRTTRCAALLPLVVLLGTACLAAPAAARKGKAPTAPGSYTDWSDELDQVQVKKSFALADYATVVVEPFATGDVALPDPDDNSYTAVKQVQGDPTTPFVQGLGEGLGKRLAVQQGEKPGGERALLVRAKVLQLDPGSRAARYWAGFGAGAARAQLAGEIVDAKSGEVLVTFVQERRSGVGLAGGGYADLLNRNLRKIGEDVALLLQAF